MIYNAKKRFLYQTQLTASWKLKNKVKLNSTEIGVSAKRFIAHKNFN